MNSIRPVWSIVVVLFFIILNLFRASCFGFRAFSLGHLKLFRISNFGFRVSILLLLILCAFALLCLKIFAARANFPVTLSHSNTGDDSRQGAKHAKFGREKIQSCQRSSVSFSDLCGLCAFARDTPSFGCDSAALGSLRLNFPRQPDVHPHLNLPPSRGKRPEGALAHFSCSM